MGRKNWTLNTILLLRSSWRWEQVLWRCGCYSVRRWRFKSGGRIGEDIPFSWVAHLYWFRYPVCLIRGEFYVLRTHRLLAAHDSYASSSADPSVCDTTDKAREKETVSCVTFKSCCCCRPVSVLLLSFGRQEEMIIITVKGFTGRNNSCNTGIWEKRRIPHEQLHTGNITRSTRFLSISVRVKVIERRATEQKLQNSAASALNRLRIKGCIGIFRASSSLTPVNFLVEVVGDESNDTSCECILIRRPFSTMSGVLTEIFRSI